MCGKIRHRLHLQYPVIGIRLAMVDSGNTAQYSKTQNMPSCPGIYGVTQNGVDVNVL